MKVTLRYPLLALTLAISALVGVSQPAQAQIGYGVSIGIAPGINIGINVPAYPRLVMVPGYPVYYDPRADFNYFFYDGLYWVFQDDDWYSSSWFDGPWHLIDRQYVPLYVLRVPVRYYRQPPIYFRGWFADAPPRWGERWGHEWEQRRPGWDHWDRRATPKAAPLPTYQQHYSGDRYPRVEDQQHELRARNYRYQPREAVTQQHFQQAQEQGQRRQLDRPSGRGDSRDNLQQRQRDQQRPPAMEPREHRQVQPQRQQQQEQQQPQVEQQDRGKAIRGAVRSNERGQKDREDNKEERDSNRAMTPAAPPVRRNSQPN